MPSFIIRLNVIHATESDSDEYLDQLIMLIIISTAMVLWHYFGNV